MFKFADMHGKGESLVHLYEEGNEVDFNIGLYFFEKLCRKVLSSDEGKKWRDDPKYSISLPQMQTAIVRKQELRSKVDVNFDGKMSFLEYLLYQYEVKASPQEFIDRSMKIKSEHPEVLKSKAELEEINKKIKSYEKERCELTEGSKAGGVKGMKAKHELAILEAGSLARDLETSVIFSEASLRKMAKMYKEGVEETPILHGSLWWIKKDLEIKKAKYGKLKK